MRRRAAPVLSAAGSILLLAAGCRSTTIRAGIWRLSIQASDIVTQQPVEIPDSRVRVRVVPGEDGREDVEIHRLEVLDPGGLRSSRDLPPIYGMISPEERILYVTQATDEFWVFRMQGNILDEETVDGSALYARNRKSDVVGLQGRWRMTWLAEE